jgi:signal transduction histidine kinase
VQGLPPLALPGADEQVRLDRVPFTDGPFVAVAVSDDGGTVIVGRNIDDEVEARATVGTALLVGAPLLLVLVALVTWWMTGWALRPVEDIREEVERISASELDRRVPDPPGHDEIARLAATMNTMLGRIQMAVDRQRRFVSDASHELRSPIAAIRQHAEVAREHPGSVTTGEVAGAVLAETERLQELVEDLLLLARLDEGAAQVATEVDLDDLVLAEAARIRATASVEVDTSAVEASRIVGNAGQLERVVRNLAQNASRYARTRLALGVGPRDGQVILTVDDDGPGIDPSDRERVLERFVRSDESRGRVSGGAGLGLAIVHEVARTHGGDVVLSESPLGGLRAEVHLPARP